MKNLLTLILLTASTLVFSQSIFEKYEDMDNVTSVIVNQKMFSMLAEMQIQTNDSEADAFLTQVKSLKNLTVYTTADDAICKSMINDVKSYIKSSNMEELMRIKDGEQNVKFYVRSGRDDNHVSELLMLVNGLSEIIEQQNIEVGGDKRVIETVLLSLVGDIDLRKVSELTNQLNVPGGDQLKKASKQ
ncbi:MAG: DUF4252 domain-containing protein [Flavobacteriaceae bacterium]